MQEVTRALTLLRRLGVTVGTLALMTLLTVGIPPAAAAAAPAPATRPPDPANVLTSFLTAYQRQPSGAEAIQYLDQSLQGEVRAGRTVAAVVGFPGDYRAFCVASYGPSGVGMSSIVFLVTLNYPNGPLQRNITLNVGPTNGIWRIAASAIPNGQTGLAASQAQPGACTAVAAAPSNASTVGQTARGGARQSGAGQVPSSLPNTGGGGGVLPPELLTALVGLALVVALACLATAQQTTAAARDESTPNRTGH